MSAPDSTGDNVAVEEFTRQIILKCIQVVEMCEEDSTAADAAAALRRMMPLPSDALLRLYRARDAAVANATVDGFRVAVTALLSIMTPAEHEAFCDRMLAEFDEYGQRREKEPTS